MKSTSKGKLWIGIFGMLLILSMLACSVPGFTTPGATPTPTNDSDFLTFSVPAPGYAISLNPGDRVPGSRLQYLGQEGDAYRVKIGGQESLKRIGDSFTWAGIVGSGVYGEYNLRLTSTLLGPLPVAGGVRLTILDWEPIQITSLPDLTNALHIGNLFINYSINKGEVIPATDMIYNGTVQQGSTEYAQFSNISGSSNFLIGDFVGWSGSLRENVFLSYSLRITSFDEDRIILTGTADIWITDPTYP